MAAAVAKVAGAQPVQAGGFGVSDRKTPYVNGKRIGPDIAALVAKYPKDCIVRYKGRWYKFMTCSFAGCKRKDGYWRRYDSQGLGARRATTHPKQTYCSEACALEGRREKRRLRQARWIAKNPEKAKAQRRDINRRWYLKNVNPQAKLRRART
jgi:hypothetical protein